MVKALTRVTRLAECRFGSLVFRREIGRHEAFAKARRFKLTVSFYAFAGRAFRISLAGGIFPGRTHERLG
jgi:hypothetical protein